MPLPAKYYAIMDGMENFIRSIPGQHKRCLAGEQGYAFWPSHIRAALDAGPDVAEELGLTVIERTVDHWKAVYYLNDVATDGTPARLEFEARLESRKNGPTVELCYWRRWDSAFSAEQTATGLRH